MRKVITYGSFDLFHEGHYNLLKRARTLGDYLIVGVTTEGYDEARGKLNVIDSLMERIENVRRTGFADEIIIEDHAGQKAEDIQKYGVDVFTVGSDWQGKFDSLKSLCEVVYLERTKGISSTLKRSGTYRIIRAGLMGSGRIARRYVPEAKYVSGLSLEGVYNPHVKSAEQFAEKFELRFSTEDEEEFYGKVDAVIIASPHATHCPYARHALAHGKHVLCEKPMALGREEAEGLFRLAEQKGCVLMEAVKTAYAPGFVRLIGMARSGIIGEVRDVEACFTRLTDGGKRELTDRATGGSFTEFGSYVLLPIIKLLGMGWEDVRFDCWRDGNGLDVYTKAYLTYRNGMAMAKTGLKVKSDGQLLISGTQGYIRVPSPWWLTKEFEICYENPKENEKVYTKFLGQGLRYELRDFVSAINGYRKSRFHLARGESIAMADIMGKFLADQGRGFPQSGQGAMDA